jgi:hypothetical protein
MGCFSKTKMTTFQDLSCTPNKNKEKEGQKQTGEKGRP